MVNGPSDANVVAAGCVAGTLPGLRASNLGAAFAGCLLFGGQLIHRQQIAAAFWICISLLLRPLDLIEYNLPFLINGELDKVVLFHQNVVHLFQESLND